MLVRKNWTFGGVLRRTWKINLFILAEVGIGLLAYDSFILKYFEVPISISAILGTAIAFFIGFTNNQAYDRWWEARKVWGMIVNDSRTWARSILTYWKGSDDSEIEKIMVKRHLAWLHLLASHLREVDSHNYLAYVERSERERVINSKHRPNTILQMQAENIKAGLDEGHLEPFAYKALDEALVRMTDQMGMCERIKNTVFPTSYVFFTKFFIFIFLLLNAMALFSVVGWWALLFGWVIGFVFYATYYNGLMIMNPFENMPSDTPMSALTRTLERNLLEMLNEPDLPEPLEPVNGEYLM